MSDAILGLGIAIILLGMLVFALIVGSIVFWIMMLIDAAKREFPNENDKLIWILVIVLVGVIGAIIYYFVGKQTGNLPK